MLMKKKVTFLAISLLLVFALARGYLYLDRTIVKEASVGAFNYIVYDNARQLYDDVLATVTSESKDVIVEGEYLDGYTLTDVKIIKEIKNEGAPFDK